MDFFNDGYEIEVKTVDGQFFAYKNGHLIMTASSLEEIREAIEDEWICLLTRINNY
jgi:hypothetical protein